MVVPSGPTPAPGVDRRLGLVPGRLSEEARAAAVQSAVAASDAREAEWLVPASDLQGEPLFRFATDEIREAERRLDGIGWFADAATTAVLWVRGRERDAAIRMATGHCVWERLTLNDGSPVRLVTTLPPGAPLESGWVRLFDDAPPPG